MSLNRRDDAAATPPLLFSALFLILTGVVVLSTVQAERVTAGMAFDPCATNPAATAQFLITDTPAPCRTNTFTPTGTGRNRLSGTEVTPVDPYGFPFAQGSPGGAQADGYGSNSSNGQIAFARNFLETTTTGVLYTIDPEGGHETALVTIPNASIGPMDWSPDGRHIVFSVYLNSHEDLYIADTDRPGVAVPLAVAPANQTFYRSPSWSYDGKYIVFNEIHQAPPIYSRVMYLRLDTPSTPQILYSVGGYSLSWSPDGTGIVYNTNDAAIAVLNITYLSNGNLSATSTSLHIWNVNDWGYVGYTSWSPDGVHIAFEEWRYPNQDGESRFVLYEKNIAGNFVQVQLSPVYIGRRYVTGWKPDGQQILAFNSIYSLMKGFPGTQTPIPTFPLANNSPRWAVWKKAWNSIGAFKPSTGQFFIRQGLASGNSNQSFYYGDANSYPIFGDWNGDGADTVGIYDSPTGRFRLRNSNTTGFSEIDFYFGNPGDKPLSGRWTDTMANDGPGVHRSSNGITYLRTTLTTGAADYFFIFGDPGDQGITGDWNSDGIDTVGIFRPGNSTFNLVNQNASGVVFADVSFSFGTSSDIPIVGDWVRLYQSRVGLFSSGAYTMLDIPNGTPAPYGSGSASATPTPPSRYRAIIQNTGADQDPAPVIPFTGRFGPTSSPIPTINSCPWGGTFNNNVCTYTYNTNQALAYALKYRFQANPLFCRYSYPGLITHDCKSNPDDTDCTNFISQSLLSGGLSMIYSMDSNPTVADKRNWFAATKSFPYITTPTQFASVTPVFERDQFSKNWSGAYPFQFPDFITFISGNPKTLNSAEFGSLSWYPDQIVGTPTPLAVSINAYATLAAKYQIQKGDIMFIYVGGARVHNALIVGWGESVMTWNDVTNLVPTASTPTLVPGTPDPIRRIYGTRQEAVNAGVRFPVPYVVDHGPAGEIKPTGTPTPYANPRPYYSLWWPIKNSSGNTIEKSFLDDTAMVGYVHISGTIAYLVNPVTPVPTGTLPDPRKALLVRPTSPNINPTQHYNGAP